MDNTPKNSRRLNILKINSHRMVNIRPSAVKRSDPRIKYGAGYSSFADKKLFFQYRKRIVQWVIHLAPSIVAAIHPSRVWEFTLEDYRRLPEGTLGRDIADFLDARQLDFLPHGEQHDVRHILLGYDMTTYDELRMQAFMVGNNWKWHITGWLMLLFGAFCLPEWWTQLRLDFARGRQARDISKIQWRKLIKMPTQSLRYYFDIPSISS